MYSHHRVFRAITGLASACLMILVSRHLCGAELSSYFAEAPEGNLVRRLRDTTSVLPPGLTLQRQLHRMPSLGVLLIENTLVNRQDQPVRVGDVTIADWTFTGHSAGDPRRYAPLTYRDEAWYGSTYWTGPDWNRIGKDWHHSGTNTSSVRRFVIPRDGQISVRGRIYKADTNGGDGVRLEIRVGGQTKWTAEIEGDDRVGVEPQLSLPVRSGDLLRFVVHRRGTIGFDTTHWDPVVTYDDGQVFQASQAFAAHRQGDGGWYYELESDAGTTPTSGAPAVHGFRRDLSLFTHTIQPNQDILLDSTDSISAWILADSYDASGVVLGVLTSDPWSIRCGQTSGGDLTMHFATARGNAPLALQPGQSIRLPNIWLAAYQGAWFKGSTLLQRIVAANSELPGISGLRHSLQIAARAVGIVDSQLIPELDLITLVQTDWQRQDQAEENIASYSRLTSRQLELTDALLEDLQREHAVPCFATAADKLRRLSSLAKRNSLPLDDWRHLYLQTRWLKRQVALANPLMDFGSLLICKRVPTSYSHLVMQYYGWRARPGGGIFVVSRPGHSLSCHDILDGQLSAGNVLEPRLSFDAKRIVFSFVTCRADEAGWDPAEIDNSVDEGFYHVWAVNVDGTDLCQVSAGAYDDLMPCWLPDGGIAFSSTRRRGYARCFGGQFSPRWHVYTLHRMNQDGSDIQLLSAHDTNEWFPTVSNTGHLIYSRWDYIDRDAVTHQNLWAARPDGTNPIAIWGNATSSPHCAFQPQPIPGSSKIVFTASAHHSIAGGSIAVVDPGVNNNGEEAIMRLTPDVPFPEAESRDIVEYYAAPWPLSEKYFLVAYSPTPLVWEPGANSRNALGIYLLDAWGNRELIYRDPDIGSTNPCPLVPRPMPPVVSSLLTTGAPPTGEMLLTDVYQGLGDVPRGTIKQLRIIQIFPKTTPVADAPRVGLAREENARAILGSVPVEADGSARFYVPAMKPLLFQALDEDGSAFQTMRTVTYVQPGERVSCYGCHESRRTTPANRTVDALRRPPSQIEAGPRDGRPFSYVETVQEVLDRHCISCHGIDRKDGNVDLSSQPRDGFTQSYWALCGDLDFWGAGTNPSNAAQALVPRFGGRNQVQVTPPGGQYGSRGSRLLKLIRAGHYEVQLSADDLRRIAAWIDCNAIFYGAYRPAEQSAQLRGERLAMPDIQ